MMEAGVVQKIQPPHAQSEPSIAGREYASAVRVGVRVGRAPDRFPAVPRPADFRPKYQVTARNPSSEGSCRRFRSKAGFYASSPLTRRIADLRSLPTADQSPLRPRPGYLGVSVCAKFMRLVAPKPKMRPEKKPPDVVRRPTILPLCLRFRWSAVATIGPCILAEKIECMPLDHRARCSYRAR
jgi:hypothetical protein